MRISVIRIVQVSAAVVALMGGSALARAADLPQSINSPPHGAGTEQSTGPGGVGVRPGIEVSAGIGTGFADTYGLGFEGRIGYTFLRGVYVGGDVQYFVGHSVNDQSAHAAFVGGQLGYKFFPTEHIEIRPYAFLGPAFITQVSSNPFLEISKTDLAVQPGVLATYHFGDIFIGGDAHYMATPSPNTLAILANAGIGF
ncbi:MAG: outer membrane beta-barrel protein [Polyangiaceae bacterium]|jgi:hypothetical protein